MSHNVVTAETVNPVVINLASIGHFAGYDPLVSSLAASAAAKELEALDFDVAALVDRYHELVAELAA